MEFYNVHEGDMKHQSHDMRWDDERPPTYNPEDYAAHLTRFTETSSSGEMGEFSTSDVFSYEMGLRQFRSVSDLMSKLMYDLQVSYDSFVTEFIRFPNNGVTKLCDLLKAIQLSQTHHQPGPGSHNSQAAIRTVQSDEFQTLLCLKLCSECEEGAAKILEHNTGLFTVSVCVMSNFSKSRVLALQLLTRLCSLPGGHDSVADSLSMLRLKFGEPVRFKFLIGMLNSCNGSSFQVSCLRFINTFTRTATSARQQVQIQCELEEAGFDIPFLKMINAKNGASNTFLKEEIEIWSTRYVDVDSIVKQNNSLQRDIEKYIDQVKTLMDRINILEKQKQTKDEENNDKLSEESDDLIVGEKKNRVAKSKNKITISVSDAQDYGNVNNNNNNNNNNVLNAELKRKKLKRVTRIDLNNRTNPDLMADCLEDFEAIKAMGDYQGLVPRQQKVLSRCKSFLGFKTKTNFVEESGEFLEERSRSAEDNFILKTDCGLYKSSPTNKVKRSKSMDIFRRSLFQTPGKKDPPVVTKSYSHYCNNKIDYVKKWQKDSMKYDLSSQQQSQPQQQMKNKYILNKNKSFYSLYF